MSSDKDSNSPKKEPEEKAAVGCSKSETPSGDKEDSSLEKIRQYLTEKLNLNETTQPDDVKILDTLDLDGVVKCWKNGGFKKIVTMVGAGISTSAGIPDFRSPKSGLYNNLKKYNLPYPEAIFELDYFRKSPQAFFQLAKELYPGTFKPTPAHYFVKLLEDKGLLVRHYTQNIDTLDSIAGISPEKSVEAHGTFLTNHCLDCRKSYSMDVVKNKIFTDLVPRCNVESCEGVIKPDIVFFGENLPERFYSCAQKDLKDCDLLIVMGTSLTVHPFASLIDNVNDDCVRLLINRDTAMNNSGGFLRSMMFGEGFCFNMPNNRRDVAWKGDCDAGCYLLADKLGYGDELRKLVKEEHIKIDNMA